MRFTVSAAAMLAALALAAPVSAASQTGLGLPASEGAGTNDDEYGWIFTANADLLVTELGFFASTAGSTQLNLWDVAGSTLLTTAFITAGDTGWNFTTLAAAVELFAGETYAVSWGGGDLGGAFATAGNFTVNPLLTYVSAAANDTVGAQPLAFDAGGALYLADIGFEEVVQTPLPAAAGFTLLGLAALGMIGRRKG